MTAIYAELAERIRSEISELDRVVNRVLHVWQQMEDNPTDQDVYLDSVALNLHGFYSGLERLFELIARHIDQSLPFGEAWHRDLLRLMSREVADIRPAVISQSNALELDEFRRFRHIVRNIYVINLAPDKMTSLIAVLPGLWSRLRDELMAFADFLGKLATADKDTGKGERGDYS